MQDGFYALQLQEACKHFVEVNADPNVANEAAEITGDSPATMQAAFRLLTTARRTYDPCLTCAEIKSDLLKVTLTVH